MDGPYSMCVTRVDSRHYTLQLRKEREALTVVLEVRVSPIQFLAETERAAADVLEACDGRQWEAAPLHSLRFLPEERSH